MLAEWASPIFLKRNTYWGQVYCALFSTIIALMALASIGLSEQMAASTQAEAYTVQFLEEELHKDPSINSFLVIGTPVPDIGESNYFIENKGEYLQYALNKKGYNVEAQVTRTETFANAKSHRTYIWSGDQWPAAILSLMHPLDSHD